MPKSSPKVRTPAMAPVQHGPSSKDSKKVLKKVARKPEPSSGSGSGPNMRNKPGKMVYYFGKSRTEGDAEMKLLLGGKGANLADMTSIGLPVPPGSPSPPTPVPRTTATASACPTAS